MNETSLRKAEERIRATADILTGADRDPTAPVTPKDDARQQAAAAAIISTFAISVVRAAAALTESARVAAVTATALEEIAAELKAARAFRERERRHGR